MSITLVATAVFFFIALVLSAIGKVIQGTWKKAKEKAALREQARREQAEFEANRPPRPDMPEASDFASVS